MQGIPLRYLSACLFVACHAKPAPTLSAAAATATVPAPALPRVVTPTAVAEASPEPPSRYDAPPPWHCGAQLPVHDFSGWKDSRNPADLAAERALHEGSPKIAPDLLGRALPAFVTRERATEWTEHPHPEAVVTVTAREWPGRPGRWVVTASDAKEDHSPSDTVDVRLAVVDARHEGDREPSVVRVARTRAPLTPRANWNVMPSDFWSVMDCDQTCGSNPMADGMAAELDALDFAPYLLTEADRAFGVITSARDSFAGGGSTRHTTLSLFHIEGDTLVPILDVP